MSGENYKISNVQTKQRRFGSQSSILFAIIMFTFRFLYYLKLYASLLSLSPVILIRNLIDMFDIDDFKHYV